VSKGSHVGDVSLRLAKIQPSQRDAAYVVPPNQFVMRAYPRNWPIGLIRPTSLRAAGEPRPRNETASTRLVYCSRRSRHRKSPVEGITSRWRAEINVWIVIPAGSARTAMTTICYVGLNNVDQEIISLPRFFFGPPPVSPCCKATSPHCTAWWLDPIGSKWYHTINETFCDRASR